MAAEDSFRKALKDAESEVVRLTLYRASVDRKLAQLKATIAALSGLLEEPSKVEEDDPTAIGDLGISEAIRQVLREAGVGMTPAEVKAKLVEAKFDLSKYANASAVIHNTLKRLETQKEVASVRVPSGRDAYAIAPEPVRYKSLQEVLAEFNSPVYIAANSYADATGEALVRMSEAQKVAQETMAKAREAMKVESATAKQIEDIKKAGGFK
jgi:hypothetical protein